MTQRILFTDHANAVGGAEQCLLMLFRHLDRKKWTPFLAGTGGPLIEQAARDGVATYVVEMPRLRRSASVGLDWIRGVRGIVTVSNRLGATVLYANSVRSAFYTAPAAVVTSRPFIWHMHDFWLSESKPAHTHIDTALKWLLCRAAARVITNSHAVAAHLPDPGNVTVVHNGIELSAFDPTVQGDEFRKAYSLSSDVPVVGMVGRLRPWKGQARFLRMAAQVRAGVPDAQFVIVGGTPFGNSGNYAKRLRRLTRDLNLIDAVTFTGHIDEVAPALAAMDVFVHPGDPEPFGLVNIEAMAMERPVVAFAHGALPEIVVDGETGLLVPPERIATLAQRVVELLEAPERARRLGRAGRRRVEACFTIEHTARGIETVLATLL